jgi:long-chain acyl-CoA synthetase
MGDLLGLKGLLVNLVVRKVKKMVPAWSLPGHVPFNAALKEGRGLPLQAGQVAASDDVAFLQYTGGTTGVSKGATLLHRNMLANVAAARVSGWTMPILVRRSPQRYLTFVCALPLYHIFALTVNALMGMQQGALNLLIPNPRDIPGFVKELSEVASSASSPRPQHAVQRAAQQRGFPQARLLVKLMLTLAAAWRCRNRSPSAGRRSPATAITEGYGLSETSPVVTAQQGHGASFTGTIGLPIPSTDIAIRDDDGNDMPLGEVGEICIKGPQVMAGYWNRPDETAKVMTADGYFKSGDMGFMDEAASPRSSTARRT